MNSKYKLYADDNHNIIAPSDTPFVEQKNDIKRSTMYSFKGSFEILHGDIAYIIFYLAKSAVDLNYCLLLLDLFTSKLYTYLIKNRSFLKKKINLFYIDISKMRDPNEVMRIQTDQKFQQNEIKKFYSMQNVKIFSTKLRGGWAFAAEQKICEFEKTPFKS